MDIKQAKMIAHRKAQGELVISPGVIKGVLIALVVIGLTIAGFVTSPSDEEWGRIQLEADIQQAREDIRQEEQDMVRAIRKAHARMIAEQNR